MDGGAGTRKVEGSVTEESSRRGVEVPGMFFDALFLGPRGPRVVPFLGPGFFRGGLAGIEVAQSVVAVEGPATGGDGFGTITGAGEMILGGVAEG